MGVPSDSIESSSLQHEPDEKATKGETVVTETGLFSRSTRNGTFENDSLNSFYEPIQEYEGRHRYDPDFEWDPKEEKRVVRKIDWKVSILSHVQQCVSRRSSWSRAHLEANLNAIN